MFRQVVKDENRHAPFFLSAVRPSAASNEANPPAPVARKLFLRKVRQKQIRGGIGCLVIEVDLYAAARLLGLFRLFSLFGGFSLALPLSLCSAERSSDPSTVICDELPCPSGPNTPVSASDSATGNEHAHHAHADNHRALMRFLLHGRHSCRRHRRGLGGRGRRKRRSCVPRSSCKNRFRRASRSHTWCKTYSGIPSQQTASVAIILSLRSPNVLRNIGQSLRTPAKRAGPTPPRARWGTNPPAGTRRTWVCGRRRSRGQR